MPCSAVGEWGALFWCRGVGVNCCINYCRVTYKQKYEQFKMLNVVCLFLLSVISLIFNENV